MSLKSMTGFGRGEASLDGIKVTVELSAVNRRQFECNFTLPRALAALEAHLHTLVQETISRGQVKGTVHVAAAPAARTAGEAGGMRLDLPRARAQIAALRRAGKQLGLADDLTLSMLLNLPDIVQFGPQPDDAERLLAPTRKAAVQALDNLCRMRTREGLVLEKDIRRRCKTLRTLHTRMMRRAQQAPGEFRDALERRLAKLSKGGSVSSEDLAREIVVFADRTDVSEELTRIGSHFQQLDKLLEGSGPAGRALDFLCQELLREINTIGSKANDGPLATHVIDFKAQLEAVREQVQNIE